MRLFPKIRQFLGTTARSENGVLTVEALLAFPILVWSVTLAFTFFDGFRQSAANLKAAYTVGDLISRETQAITQTYVDSMHLLMQRMVNNRSEMKLRMTLVVFDEDDDRHYVRWSAERGYNDVWDNNNVANLRDALPPMPDQDTLIIVETSNHYDPMFKTVWMDDDHTFTNFVFTRPRFTNEIASNL